MKFRSKRHVYRSMADDGGGGGSPADPAAPAVPANPAPTGQEGQPATLLTTGKDGQPAPVAERIPEKYRVMDAAGALDLEASTRKMADGLDAAVKRIGTGDLPPASPEEYAPEGLPEGVNMEELKADPMYQGFLKGAHAQGLTNKQIGYVLNEYLARAPELTKGAQALDVETATTQLREVWKDDASFKSNLQAAYGVTSLLATRAGVDMAAIESSAIANDPMFVRMMAALAPEFAEDLPAAAGAGQSNAAAFDAEIAEIRAAEGFNDANHPQHKVLMQRLTAAYEKRYSNRPAPGVTTIPVKKT